LEQKQMMGAVEGGWKNQGLGAMMAGWATAA
jgi:hypothetical protein